MTDTLTENDLRRAIKALSQHTEPLNPFWVENEYWYKGEWAKELGFLCTQEELQAAKTKENGFIKKANGVDLYLSSFIPFMPSPQPLI